jgi:tetratricopeptide (TPR) repeat protein
MAQAENDELPRNRWWLKLLIGLVILAGLCVGGFLLYRKYEPERLTKRAQEYFDKDDHRNAVLTLRRALEIDPTNVSASRLMAKITESLQVPDALDWRRRLNELNPGSAADALAFAGTALRQGKTAVANQALASVSPEEQNTGAFQSGAGTAAMAAGNLKQAEQHFTKALALEPENELHQYNLATLHLQSSDAAKRTSAAAKLEKLAEGGRVQMFARRSLTARLITDQKFEEALARSTELMNDKAAAFPDRITHLDLLRRLDRPELAEAVTAAQSAAAADPASAAMLIDWFRVSGQAARGVEWGQSLDTKTAEHPQVRIGLAECLFVLKKWPELLEFASRGEWGGADYARLGYAACALHEQGDREGAKARWSAATAAAKGREAALRLIYLPSRIGWTEAMRETLWAASAAPGGDWALLTLNRLYRSEGDTAGLLRVAQRFLELDPQNAGARNNTAALSLLLGQDPAPALETARKLHEQSSANADFATTYALALHQAGRSAEGLAVLKKLPPATLREPSVAGYFGMLLRATGAAVADEYVQLARQGQFLPEEKALFFPRE